jgi:hypothetical protein
MTMVRRVPGARGGEREAAAWQSQRTTPATPADTILSLQRSAGNAAVSQLLARNESASRTLARQGAGAATGTAARPAANFLVRDVDREITETISHAPAAFSQWNGTYPWRAKWRLRLDLRAEIGQLQVIVRLHSAASAAVKSAWENAITAKWSNKFAFCVRREHPIEVAPGVFDRYEEMYPIQIVIAWVDNARDAHYVIQANTPGATEGGRAGVGGTTSMTGWGTVDTQDMTHEFGHMLGCPEEYFTTNGVNYAAGGLQGFRDPRGGVMNNPAGAALARNFDLIRKEAATRRGFSAARAEIAPWR